MEQTRKRQKTDHGNDLAPSIDKIEFEVEKIRQTLGILDETRDRLLKEQDDLKQRALKLQQERRLNSWDVSILKGVSFMKFLGKMSFDSYDEAIKTSTAFTQRIARLRAEWQRRLLNILKEQFAFTVPRDFGNEKTFLLLICLCAAVHRITKRNQNSPMAFQCDVVMLASEICDILQPNEITVSIIECVDQMCDDSCSDYMEAHTGKLDVLKEFVLIGRAFPIYMMCARVIRTHAEVFPVEQDDRTNAKMLNFAFIADREKRKAVKGLLAITERRANKTLIMCQRCLGVDKENIWQRMPIEMIRSVFSHL